MRVAALCAGYGGLELGLRMVYPDAELVWVAETDPHASAVLDARFGVPNLGDLTQIVDPPPVDVVTAGFPCQPFSTAGLRKGTEDERWLIDDVCRVARAAGAGTLVLENVPGLLTANDGNALARVCAAMAETGFSRWEWTTVRASDVGACHRRERWFCVASHPDGARRPPRSGQPEPVESTGQRQATVRFRSTANAAHASSVGRGALPRPSVGEPGGLRRHGPSDDHRAPAAHADGAGSQRAEPAWRCHLPAWGSGAVPRFGRYSAAVARWEAIHGPAPEPLHDDRLNPRFVEWMMGLEPGWVTDVIGTRAHALRILGNGVVPLQAAAAITELTSHRKDLTQ